jgi:DNA-directed RNA polymerase sigma subunit (sigma70/sigma32)
MNERRYLSRDETTDLFAEIRRPWPIACPPAERSARSATLDGQLARLIDSLEDMIWALSHRFAAVGADIDDLRQSGRDGVLWAVRDYEPEWGTLFPSFAYQRIRRSILLERALALQVVKLGSYFANRRAEFRQALWSLVVETGRKPSASEVIERLGWRKGSVETWERMRTLRPEARIWPVSREAGRGGASGLALEDFAVAPTTPSEGPPLAALAPLLEALPPRQRRVVELRIGLGGAEPLTLKVIGGMLGVTKERVRQIEVAAMARLRELAAEQFPEEVAAAS